MRKPHYIFTDMNCQLLNENKKTNLLHQTNSSVRSNPTKNLSASVPNGTNALVMPNELQLLFSSGLTVRG